MVRGAFREKHTKKDGQWCHGAGAASLPCLGPGGPSCHRLPGAGQEDDQHGKNSAILRCPGRGRGCRAALRCQQLFPAPCRPEIGWIFLITSLLVSDFPRAGRILLPPLLRFPPPGTGTSVPGVMGRMRCVSGRKADRVRAALQSIRPCSHLWDPWGRFPPFSRKK